MGSYLSVVNNTNDTYLCKLGPDMAAAEIFGGVFTVLGFATIFLGAPAIGVALTSVGLEITATVEAVTVIAEAAGSVATAAGFFAWLTGKIDDDMKKDGFVVIAPGSKHTWGKMSLSLWQQAECYHSVKESDTRGYQESVFMRPIFSGATDNSNIDHEIQHWINEVGFQRRREIILNVLSAEEMASSIMEVSEQSPLSSPTPYQCDLCFGSDLVNLDSMAFIPGHGFLTCRVVQEAASTGGITEEECPLLAQYLAPCGCPGRPLPDFAKSSIVIQESVEEVEVGISDIKGSINDLESDMANVLRIVLAMQQQKGKSSKAFQGEPVM